MIYILEGADGTGKSTLAEKLARHVHGMVIHAYFDELWDMKTYHETLIKVAQDLDQQGIPVVLDRWALSELVYGKAFRGGPSFNVAEMINGYGRVGVKWVYCKNDNAVENHNKNKKERHEMFDDMSQVVKLFDQAVTETPQLNWYTFDYDKVKTPAFLKKLTEDEV